MTPVLLPTSYSTEMLVLSYVVSAVGAYVALSAARNVRNADGQISRFNIFLAGLALGGVGIWSMHFIGMVAWKVDLAVGYSLPETLLSLVAAVVVSSLALGYVAAGAASFRRLMVARPLAGLGVAVMHYLGMYSMRFQG